MRDLNVFNPQASKTYIYVCELGSPLFLTRTYLYERKGAIMGLDIYLQDEDGEVLDSMLDPASILPRLLPSYDEETSLCLRYIDPGGDTVFNNLQMRPLIEEFDVVLQRVKGKEEEAFVTRIIEMARRCRDEVHLYLKFCGD